jgi:hypothetical protein
MRLLGHLGSIIVNVQRDNAALQRIQRESLHDATGQTTGTSEEH